MNSDAPHTQAKGARRVVEDIANLRILVVGDLMLDRYLWGKCDRISPEAPVPVVQVQRVEDRVGGAGLVVRNLRELGAKVQVCGVVGVDSDGAILTDLLAGQGVDIEGIVPTSVHPTVLKTRVVAHSQQIVRVDREDLSPLPVAVNARLAQYVAAVLPAVDAVIISDYGKGVIDKTVLREFGQAHAAKLTGLGVKPVVLDPHPRNFGLYPGSGISVAKPNRTEAEQATGMRLHDEESYEVAARRLLELWGIEMAMVTLGEDGLILVSHPSARGSGSFERLEAEALSVFDVSGAGDAVTAVFTGALAAGAAYGVAGQIANLAAGMVVAEVGTVPVRRDMLLGEVEAFYLL